MARIQLGPFGGLSPSVDPRNLTPDGAQVARNLDFRFGDFRPLKGIGASVSSVAAAAKSIFRTPSGVWLSSANDVDYVNGQIADAASERVYLTGHTTYPEAWQGGTYRQLGVPAPTTAPTFAVVVNDEFTHDEAAAEEARIISVIAADALADDSAVLVGTDPLPAAPNDLVGVDPYRDDVMVHLRMSTDFHDTGPRAMVTNSSDTSPTGTHVGTSPVISTLTDGPPFTTPVKYGHFADACGIAWATEFDLPEWTLDAWVRLPEAITGVRIYERHGGIRAISLITATRNDKFLNTLVRVGSDYATDGDNGVMMSAGVPWLPADTWGLVSITCSRAAMLAKVYFNGGLVATLRVAGQLAGWVGLSNFLGDVSEFRITARVRSDFTVPTAPFPGAPADITAAATGFWLPHGASGVTPALPTTADGDYAYLGRMDVIGTVMYNANEEYLRVGALGATVQYGGAWWYAVPVKRYKASVLTLDRVAYDASLTAMLNSLTPPTQLLPNDVIDDIVADVGDLYDALVSPTKSYKDNLLSAEQALVMLVQALGVPSSTSTPVKAALFTAAMADVTAAADALANYYTRIDDEIRTLVAGRYGAAISAALPAPVDRLVETRAYVFTFVTDWGEESAPSPPSDLKELDQNDSTTVTVTSPPGSRNIVGWRLYRSSTTNVGGAYQLVVDKSAPGVVLDGAQFDYMASAQLTFSDTQAQEELQESLQTMTWVEPPAGLIGLIGLPNGIMAGFFGKTLCFSEPYHPYAWPVEYQSTLEYDIVGLGVFGQTVAILTKGSPYFCSGADSASMSAQKVESTQSCVGKRTIASVEGGVFFASPDGLCIASGSGVQLASGGAYTREAWEALQADDGFATFSEGVYYLAAPGVTDGLLTFDLNSKRVSTVEGTGYTELYTDLVTDTLYVVTGATVCPLLGGAVRTGLWRSKRFELPNIPSMAWLRLAGPMAASTTVRIYGDGALAATLTVTSSEPVRLPAGRFRAWEVEVEGTAIVTNAVLASATLELLE